MGKDIEIVQSVDFDFVHYDRDAFKHFLENIHDVVYAKGGLNVDELKIMIQGKQDKLIAGENITIDANNVISAIGGSSGVKIKENEAGMAGLVFERDKDYILDILNSYLIDNILPCTKTYIRNINVTNYKLHDIILSKLEKYTIVRLYFNGKEEFKFSDATNLCFYFSFNQITFDVFIDNEEIENRKIEHLYNNNLLTTEGFTNYNNTPHKFNTDTNILKTDNVFIYTPTGDYNPATKKYVDDAVAGAGGGSSTGIFYYSSSKGDLFNAFNAGKNIIVIYNSINEETDDWTREYYHLTNADNINNVTTLYFEHVEHIENNTIIRKFNVNDLSSTGWGIIEEYYN